MEIKTKTILQIKKTREYKFECENESALGEIFDVLSEMRGYILQRMKDDEAKKQESEKQE